MDLLCAFIVGTKIFCEKCYSEENVKGACNPNTNHVHAKKKLYIKLLRKVIFMILG